MLLHICSQVLCWNTIHSIYNEQHPAALIVTSSVLANKYVIR